MSDSPITTSADTPLPRHNHPLSWKRLAVIVFLLLPVLASVVYMWAMWDPSKNLRDVRLAVVNEDAGLTVKGKDLRYGNRVTEGLLQPEYLAFEEVDADTAQKGLNNGTYLFTVTIPENFTAKLATVLKENPEPAGITISYNDFNGTQGQVLTKSLVPKIQQQVTASVSELYAKKLTDGVSQLGDGLENAADGAKRLDEGAEQLRDGIAQGQDGAAKLDEGAKKLESGAHELSEGTTQLLDGANSLADGTARLGDGMARVDDGVAQLTDTLLPLLEQAQGPISQLGPVEDALRAIGKTAEADRLATLRTELDASNPNGKIAQLNQLKEGTSTLRYMLNDPTSEYYGGVLKLRDGIAKANDGAHRLADGTTQLSDGTGKLKDGTARLYDGSGRLVEGTGEMSTKLSEGVEKAPKVLNSEGSAHQVAVPIVYTETNANPVQTLVNEDDPTIKSLSSGASMLVVMVFGFLLMGLAAILIPHVFGSNRRRSVFGPTLKSFLSLFGIGTVIMLILAGSATLIGWHPVSWTHTIIGLVLGAGAAAAGNQMLRALFGRVVGSIAILTAFAFGLFSFGGIWPLATVPGVFRAMHPFNLMTYTRQTFIEGTQGSISGQFLQASILLIVATVVFLGITLLVRARRVKQLSEEGAAAMA